MAEFQEVMRNYHRMCENATMCANCELNEAMEEVPDEEVRSKNLSTIEITSCSQYMEYFPDKAEEIIQHWAAEHPEKRKKTRLEVLEERFPTIKQHYSIPCICPYHIFGGNVDDYECTSTTCAECWNRPAPDEYQER